MRPSAPVAAVSPSQPSAMPVVGATLSIGDRDLMNALAAFQLRYGKPDEALAILQCTNRLWPNDPQTLRLLTQAFIAIDDYESAELTDGAYQRLSRGRLPTRADLVMQAIVHFGRARAAEAKRMLLASLGMNRGEAA